MRQSGITGIATAFVLVNILAVSAFSGEGKNEKAPLFTLKTLSGENYSLQSNLGKGPIIIGFWATWCGPCILEMKSMKKCFSKYSTAGLEILAVSIDDNTTQPRVPPVVRMHKFPYTVLLDENRDVYRAFHCANVPQLFIIDTGGNIVYSQRGYHKGDEEKIDAFVAGLIGDKK